MNALLPILAALLMGKSPAIALTMLQALTVQQWAGVASDVLQAAPGIVQNLQQIDPTLNARDGDILFHQIVTAITTGYVGFELKRWLAANADKAVMLQPGIVGQ